MQASCPFFSIDIADYLAKKGMPFRDAYTTVGNLVYYCTQNGKLLEELCLLLPVE